jgi:hypothetical protein
MNADAWVVRAVYVVLDDSVSIDELDQRVGGRVLHNGLGGTWSLPGQAERAQLEWELPSFADARAALDVLLESRGIERPEVGPTDDNRAAHPGQYDVTRSQVHAGRVRCPGCEARIPEGEDSFFAVQGVKNGDEFVLRCPFCSLPMTWRLVDDESTPGAAQR